MTTKERMLVAVILSIISVMIIMDIISDTKEFVFTGHILIEGLSGFVALVGVFYMIKGSMNLQHKLTNSIKENKRLLEEAAEWKLASQKYIEGLSRNIDEQLTKWNLSNAEKEVALLLLKGLSLKEIAEIRKTSEKTARVQSINIYSKSGLAGRSELSAFFLEDLLLPQNVAPISQH